MAAASSSSSRSRTEISKYSCPQNFTNNYEQTMNCTKYGYSSPGVDGTCPNNKCIHFSNINTQCCNSPVTKRSFMGQVGQEYYQKNYHDSEYQRQQQLRQEKKQRIGGPPPLTSTSTSILDIIPPLEPQTPLPLPTLISSPTPTITVPVPISATIPKIESESRLSSNIFGNADINPLDIFFDEQKQRLEAKKSQSLRTPRSRSRNGSPERNFFDCDTQPSLIPFDNSEYQSLYKNQFLNPDMNNAYAPGSCYIDNGSVGWTPYNILKSQSQSQNQRQTCYILQNKNLCQSNITQEQLDQTNINFDHEILFQNLPILLKLSLQYIDMTQNLLNILYTFNILGPGYLNNSDNNNNNDNIDEKTIQNYIDHWSGLWSNILATLNISEIVYNSTNGHPLSNRNLEIFLQNYFNHLGKGSVISDLDLKELHFIVKSIEKQKEFIANIYDFINDMTTKGNNLDVNRTIIENFEFLQTILNLTLKLFNQQIDLQNIRQSNTFIFPSFETKTITSSSSSNILNPATTTTRPHSLENKYDPNERIKISTIPITVNARSGSQPKIILSQIRKRSLDTEADQTCITIPPELLIESPKITGLGINKPWPGRELYLKPHQLAIVYWILRPSVTGLLLDHTPGSGKTMSAITAIMALFYSEPDINGCWLLIKKTTTNHWLSEFKKCNDKYFKFKNNIKIYYGGRKGQPQKQVEYRSTEKSSTGKTATKWKTIYIETNESFKSRHGVSKPNPKQKSTSKLKTSNNNFDIKTITNPKCNKMILVVDEVHYLKGEIKNTSGILAANVLACARTSSKIILMTGTPSPNDEYDAVNYVAMIDRQPGPPYTQRQWGSMNDEAKKRYFQCKISYYDCNWRTGPIEFLKLFPKVKEIYKTIFMPSNYLIEYNKLENIALNEARNDIFGGTSVVVVPGKKITKKKAKSTSRGEGDDQLSTAFYNHLRLINSHIPLRSPKVDWIMANILTYQNLTVEKKKIIIFSTLIIAGIGKVADRLDELNGVAPVQIDKVKSRSRSKSKSISDDDNINLDEKDDSGMVSERKSAQVNKDKNRLYVEISGPMTARMRLLGLLRYLAKDNERIYLKSYADRILGKNNYTIKKDDNNQAQDDNDDDDGDGDDEDNDNDNDEEENKTNKRDQKNNNDDTNDVYITLGEYDWKRIENKSKTQTIKSKSTLSSNSGSTNRDDNTNWWSPVNVILLGPAGKEGLNLKGTDIEVGMEPDWNLASQDQFEARGIRMYKDEKEAQKQKVTIFRPFLVKYENQHIKDYLTQKYYRPLSDDPQINDLNWILNPENIKFDDVLDSIPDDLQATDILKDYGIDTYLWRKSLLKYAKDRKFVDTIIKPSSIERNPICWNR
jgi:hypothetical protein